MRLPVRRPRSGPRAAHRGGHARRIFHRHPDADDLRHDGARELGAQAAALAGGVPHPEQQRRRRGLQDRAGVPGRGQGEPRAHLAVLERLPVQQAVAQDGVEHPVRCFQRGDLADRLKARAREVHGQAGQGHGALARGLQKGFLHAVGLRLHAVDQHAPHVGPSDTAAFEDMARRIVFLVARIGGREQRIARATRRLQRAAAPERGILGDGLDKVGVGQRHGMGPFDRRWVGAARPGGPTRPTGRLLARDGPVRIRITERGLRPRVARPSRQHKRQNTPPCQKRTPRLQRRPPGRTPEYG